jgi:hypothetical protein
MHLAALALCCLAACLTRAAATSASGVETVLAGAAAKLVDEVQDKVGGVTRPTMTTAKDFAYPPSKLTHEALKAGVGFKCGAGVGMCPPGHCCR